MLSEKTREAAVVLLIVVLVVVITLAFSVADPDQEFNYVLSKLRR